MWFYDISDPASSQLAGYYGPPRTAFPDSLEKLFGHACTNHNFSVLPMRDGSYIASTSYYGAGLSVVDFSDPANPKEIAYYVHRPGGVNPDTWAAYWYNGRIYTNDFQSTFGVGVYELAGTTSRKVVRYFRGDTNPQVQRSSFR